MAENKDGKKILLSDWRKHCALLGSFLLIIPSGIYSMWGNISVYALSYVYKQQGMSRVIRTPWEVSAYLLSMYVGYNSTGYFLKCCNKHVVLLLVIFISNGGYFTAFVALTFDLIPLAASVVFLLGFCIGVVESVVFKYIADWQGSKKGYLISIACSAMNFGPFIMNPIVTAYVNPGNLSPNSSDGKLLFLTQDVVMKNVPSLFILLGSMFAGFQLIGFVLINLYKPNKTSSEDSKAESEYSKTESKDLKDESVEMRDEIKDNYGSMSPGASDDVSLNGSFGKENTEMGTSPVPESAENSISDNNPETETDAGLTPCQTLCTSVFYILWLCNGCRDCSTVLLNSYYKAFGQNWISDDYLLTAVGSVLGIAGGFARVTWGFVLDRYKLKYCLMFVFSCVSCSLMFMYFTPKIDKWLYLVVTVFYASVHSCLFPTVVTSTLVLFGKSHFNHNLGLVNTASMVADIASPPVFESLLTHFGWFWIFGSVVSLFILTLTIIIIRFPGTIKIKK